MTKVRKPGGFFEENAVKLQSGCRAFYGYTVLEKEGTKARIEIKGREEIP